MNVADSNIEFTRTATINNRTLETNSLHLYERLGAFLDVFKTKRCAPGKVFTNLSGSHEESQFVNQKLYQPILNSEIPNEVLFPQDGRIRWKLV